MSLNVFSQCLKHTKSNSEETRFVTQQPPAFEMALLMAADLSSPRASARPPIDTRTE